MHPVYSTADLAIFSQYHKYQVFLIEWFPPQKNPPFTALPYQRTLQCQHSFHKCIHFENLVEVIIMKINLHFKLKLKANWPVYLT